MYGDREYSTGVHNGDKWDFLTIPPIDKLCAILKEKFEGQKRENERLEKINQELRDEHYKDNEIAKLVKQNEELKSRLRHCFTLDEDDLEKIDELKGPWKKTKLGTIGGGFEYRFRPTSLGTIITVVGPDNIEHCIRELDS